jgi:hypothetical protein
MGGETTLRHATRFAWWVSTAAVAAGSLIASGSSLAHTEGFDSKVTIRERDGGTEYGGRVLSDRAACERNRAIKLYRSNGEFVGNSTTDEEGRWSFHFVGQRYYARVSKRVDGSGGHRHICRADRSPTTD